MTGRFFVHVAAILLSMSVGIAIGDQLNRRQRERIRQYRSRKSDNVAPQPVRPIPGNNVGCSMSVGNFSTVGEPGQVGDWDGDPHVWTIFTLKCLPIRNAPCSGYVRQTMYTMVDGEWEPEPAANQVCKAIGTMCGDTIKVEFGHDVPGAVHGTQVQLITTVYIGGSCSDPGSGTAVGVPYHTTAQW